jgi:endonuclease III
MSRAAGEAVAPSPSVVQAALRERYADFGHYNRRNPLEEVIFIILSQQTDEAKYRGAYRRIRREFPTFNDLQLAPADRFEPLIREAGLSRQKAARITGLFRALVERRGRPSLSYLRRLSDQAAEAELLALPGVGKKTARCVLLYSLDRDVFPVDTHCWRIVRRLGWVHKDGSDDCSDGDMDRAQAHIPKELRRSLHVNFVSLGREFCRAENPRCDACPLSDMCPSRSGSLRAKQ